MTNSILNTLTSAYMTVTMTGTALSMRKNYTDGAEAVARDTGGDSKSFSVSRKLLPPGYDAEYKEVVKAYGAIRAAFYDMTVAFGMSSVGNKKRAKGERLIAVAKVVDGSFESTINKLMGELDTARDRFRNTLPGTLARLQMDAKLGSTFNVDDYPTQADIDGSFRWALDGPTVIADGSQLDGMPLTGAIAEAVLRQMEKRAEAQVDFAQQDIADELMDYLKSLAENTHKLWEYHNTPESQRAKKAPRIFSTLTTNVSKTVEKIRLYAIPETEKGGRLLEIADEVLERLDVDRIDASDIKENPTLANKISHDAAAIIDAIEGMNDFTPTFS